MREAAFVKQNKDKWLRFENVLEENQSDLSPDELSLSGSCAKQASRTASEI